MEFVVQTTQRTKVLLFVAGLCAALAFGAQSATAAGWDPYSFKDENILRLRTVCPGEGEYWFPVWLVVIDRNVFVRLGSTAAGRVQCNTAPTLGVEVAGQKFDVRGMPSPEMADRVNHAMAEKYTSDLLIRWFPHPLVLLLEP